MFAGKTATYNALAAKPASRLVNGSARPAAIANSAAPLYQGVGSCIPGETPWHNRVVNLRCLEMHNPCSCEQKVHASVLFSLGLLNRGVAPQNELAVSVIANHK